MAVHKELQGKEGLALLWSEHAESLWKSDKQSKCEMIFHAGLLKVLKLLHLQHYACNPPV